MGNLIPFNPEAFKAGQKARHKATADKVAAFRFESILGQLVCEYDNGYVDKNITIDELVKEYVMVSRHQALIDSYDPEEITPTTKTVYEWIHGANVGNVNYFVSSWVADEDVEYFFGLDTPKQKYKTGRSWEVEV